MPSPQEHWQSLLQVMQFSDSSQVLLPQSDAEATLVSDVVVVSAAEEGVSLVLVQDVTTRHASMVIMRH